MNKTILIVEDEADALGLLEVYFDMQGYQVYCARNGVEACELLMQYQPSVILSDYLMPKMNGIEFCEKLKVDVQYKNIPFVLMTGTPHLPESSLPDSVLHKPMRLDVLKDRIEHLIART